MRVCQWILPLFALQALSLFAASAEKEKPEAYEAIKDKEINEITYEECEQDNGFEIPFAKDLENLGDDQKKRLDEFFEKVDKWDPGKVDKVGQKVRTFVALCALADAGHSEFEAEVPLKVFERLKTEVPKDKLMKACAWVALKPKDGDVVKTAPDLGLDVEIDEEEIRGRSVVYAKKMLGRLLGKLPIQDK
jgi:hypothetical protein